METRIIDTDITIIGGGIAGLWLLNRLSTLGYSVLLFEANTLGMGQSIVSQGMIHGGIKYTLEGRNSRSSMEVADMPDIWRSCLKGEGSVDLTGVKLLSEEYYMWSGGSISTKFMSFLGSKVIRGRVSRLDQTDYPAVFCDPAFKGHLYKLQDLVIDVPSLLNCLRDHYADRCYRLPLPEERINLDERGQIDHLQISSDLAIRSKRYIFAAGEGNQRLCDLVNLNQAMQRRPLHQVFVRHHHRQPLHAHCLGRGSTPRLTITSHPVASGATVWNIGGEIAESGVNRSAARQIDFARRELKINLPWLDVSQADWATHRVDRAEPLQQGRLRPNAAFARAIGKVIVTWPVKLTLVPQLAAHVERLLKKDGVLPGTSDPLDTEQINLQTPQVSAPVWQTLFG